MIHVSQGRQDSGSSREKLETEFQDKVTAGDHHADKYRAMSVEKTTPTFRCKMMGSELPGAPSGGRTWVVTFTAQEHQLKAQQQPARAREKDFTSGK